jgi:hypothetical protein
MLQPRRGSHAGAGRDTGTAAARVDHQVGRELFRAANAIERA